MLTSYTIDEAKALIRSKVEHENSHEIVELGHCHGRILAADIVSDTDVPGFRRSTMDGYAVRAEDLTGASGDSPVRLRLIGRIEMGKQTQLSLNAGECAYIPTGGMLPVGADGILIIENAISDGNVVVEARTPVKQWEFVVFEDEDVKNGETILKKGKRIRPYEMGVLSSIGRTRIPVFHQLKIGILITGDEIVTPYETPKPGQVRDINSYLLEGLIRSTESTPVLYNTKSDNLEEIYEATEKAVNECDIVLVSGGSSVGVKDFTKTVFQRLPGSEMIFHGLALKPGKPTLVYKSGSKLLFGMPGHPLACAVVFNTLVRYYIELLNCVSSMDKDHPVVCELAEGYAKARGREEYIPVFIQDMEGKLLATPISGKSGIISTFSRAWGYFRTDKNQSEVNKGDIVAVYRI